MKSCIKPAAAVLAVSAVLAFHNPVFAASYTTPDSVLSLNTPDDTWLEIHDPDTWVTLGNGNDTITLLHYSNGESLPAPSVADAHYSKVYQTVLSTQNEVFIVTGSVVDATNFKKIRKAVQSTKINKYDTKKAIGTKNSPSNTGYKITDTDETYYVTSSGLNVRAGYSTNEARLGGLSYADAVHVNGIVKNDGEEIGWYRIDYKGGNGFVYSEFLSASRSKIQQEEIPAATNSTMTLYASNGSDAEIRQYTDGTWYDDDGNRYAAEGGGQWSCSDGTYWSSNPPVQNQSNTMTLSDSYGDSVQIFQDSDGFWMDGNGVYYEAEGAGIWSDSYGNNWSSN